MKKVPFFANPDNQHCLQAGIKSILKYFLPDKDFSWKELEQLTDFVEGKGTWTNKVLVSLHEMGFDVVDISTFDIDAFITRGGDYLIERYGSEAGEYAVKMSNIPQEQATYKLVKKLNIHKHREPTLNNIKHLLDHGWLVCSTVNSKHLNDKPGFEGHFIVITGYDSSGLIIHDSGPDPLENRHVEYSKFNDTWSIPDKNSRLLSAFRLKKAVL